MSETQRSAGPLVICLTLRDVEIVGGWYWHKVDTEGGTTPEDDALYRIFFDLIGDDDQEEQP